ncbi:MAG: PAS domain-containing protein [Bacteroidota bacterium]
MDDQEYHPLKKTLPQVAVDLALLTGLPYFNALTKELSAILAADIVLVAEILSGEKQARTVYADMGGETAENFGFELCGSVFSTLLDGYFHIFPTGITTYFPDDYLLIDLSVEGFAGIPILNSQQNVTGFFVAMFQSAIENQSGIESTLKFFAPRVSAELELKVMTDKLKEKESLFLGLSDLVEDVLVVINFQGTISFVSSAASGLFGLRPDEMTGHQFAEFLTPDTRILGMQEFEKFIASDVLRFELELKVTDKNKNHHAVRWSAVKTKIGDEITGIAGILRKLID